MFGGSDGGHIPSDVRKSGNPKKKLRDTRVPLVVRPCANELLSSIRCRRTFDEIRRKTAYYSAVCWMYHKKRVWHGRGLLRTSVNVPQTVARRVMFAWMPRAQTRTYAKTHSLLTWSREECARGSLILRRTNDILLLLLLLRYYVIVVRSGQHAMMSLRRRAVVHNEEKSIIIKRIITIITIIVYRARRVYAPPPPPPTGRLKLSRRPLCNANARDALYSCD